MDRTGQVEDAPLRRRAKGVQPLVEEQRETAVIQRPAGNDLRLRSRADRVQQSAHLCGDQAAAEALDLDTLHAYNAKATGTKYLINPSK